MTDLEIQELIENGEKQLKGLFKKLDEVALFNQKKILDAFRENRVAARHLTGSLGYGYDDCGRDLLCRLFSSVFHTEAAIVSPLISSGTHAITIALFGVLRPGDTLLSISGKPYDTLANVINTPGIGSLKDFGVRYDQVDLKNGSFDKAAVERKIKKGGRKLIYITRSRGYEWRDSLTIEKIRDIIAFIKGIDHNAVVFVDNCYGEFTKTEEPTDAGADLIAGSLIKNAGGGIAPTGGYIAGKQHLVEMAASRLTAPGIGAEIGSYVSGYLPFYQGLFLAAHTVNNAQKGSVLFGTVLKSLGYETSPATNRLSDDIIRAVKFDTKEELISFCRTIQSVSPIDSFVTPEPWAMPGYEDQVIMAAGTFVQGASIELSCDSPIKAPYIAYIQGGLTYEHLKIALTECVKALKG